MTKRQDHFGTTLRLKFFEGMKLTGEWSDGVDLHAAVDKSFLPEDLRF